MVALPFAFAKTTQAPPLAHNSLNDLNVTNESNIKNKVTTE